MDRSNGCNRPPHDWVWPRPSEIEVARQSVLRNSPTKTPSMSPDPFDFLVNPLFGAEFND